MNEIQRSKSLHEFYRKVTRYEYTNPDQARQLFDEILDSVDEYTGIPDTWHNTVMVAGRVRHDEAELAIIQAGLREWPDEVDLLCDELQLRHSSSLDLTEAKRIWERLKELDIQKTYHNWRFWSHGAIYNSTKLNDPKTGLKLLDRGLYFVPRDNLSDIIRAYRRVLIDSVPHQKLNSKNKIRMYHRKILKILEERYKLGIELGVENGYTLAVELAKLYQEQANKIADVEESSEDYLKKAFHYLCIAEQLYTGSGLTNHPVWDIYVPKIRIFMAQRKYSEALKLLHSLPEFVMERDSSLKTMFEFAALMTGEQISPDSKRSEKSGDEAVTEQIISILGDEETLYHFAQHDRNVLINLFKVAQRIQKDTEEKTHE